MYLLIRTAWSIGIPFGEFSSRAPAYETVALEFAHERIPIWDVLAMIEMSDKAAQTRSTAPEWFILNLSRRSYNLHYEEDRPIVSMILLIAGLGGLPLCGSGGNIF